MSPRAPHLALLLAVAPRQTGAAASVPALHRLPRRLLGGHVPSADGARAVALPALGTDGAEKCVLNVVKTRAKTRRLSQNAWCSLIG